MKRITYLILFLSFLYSCKKENNRNNKIIYNYDKYIDDNFHQYSHIRGQLIDTLMDWRADSLDEVHHIFYDDYWQIDSLLLFNMDSTKFYTTLNQQHLEEVSRTDFIKGIDGIKSNDKWYFLMGGNYYIGRQRQTDQNEAQTFDELSYISHTRMMSRFLKVDEEGNYEVDYDELDHYFYGRYKTYGDENKIDSLHLTRIAAYHEKKIDPKEIERVRESIKNSVRPLEVPKPKKSFIRRLFEKEEKTPLFETEEWKNRRKKSENKQ